MKTKFTIKIITGTLIIILLFGVSILTYSYPNGVAGRTLKPGSTPGCTCHQSSSTAAVLVSVTGPSTLVANATGTYTFSVSRSSGTFNTGGIDIAVNSGTLGIGTSTGIKMLSGEVVHSAAFSGATTKTFTLTAPSSPGTVTIYCTGAGGTNPPNWNHGTSFNVTITAASGINQLSEVVDNYSLSQNFPNPFNPNTNIEFSIPKSEFVKLTVFDITGKTISELVNNKLEAGKYSTTWNASDLSSGMYFYKIQAGDFVEIRKMTLIK